MRLIGTFQNEIFANELSQYLKSKDIENEVDTKTNNDWGSDAYSAPESFLWIVDEDKFDQAKELLEEFKSGQKDLPTEKKIDILIPASKEIPTITIHETPRKNMSSRASLPQKSSLGPITIFILGLCTLLFIISQMTTPEFHRVPKAIPMTPLFTAPMNKVLMYDYPKAFDKIDQIVETYGLEKVVDPAKLPAQGLASLKSALLIPYWQGMYDKLLIRFQHANSSWNFSEPMFEKIREGEVWRLLTPCFLHADIFHIFFNMCWVIILGRQIERLTTPMKYILLMVIGGLISNTAQYLMSGANFIGFSGVITTMITFIWARQKYAAWEGYQLQPSMFYFIGGFVLAIFFLQVVLFVLQATEVTTMSPGIANTAHLVGGVVGYILGRTSLFAAR